MPHLLRLFVPLSAALLLSHCASAPEEEAPLGEPVLEKLEHARLDPPPGPDAMKLDAEEPAAGAGLAPVAGKEGKFVIRDAKGAMRVQGTLKGGRMDGDWKYFDPSGRRLAEVAYLADQRHGAVTVYYVSTDGKAAGSKKMTGVYLDGALNGFARSFHRSGGKYLEREFDRGILQASRGWQEDGKELTDGAAQAAGLEVSRAEDALLSELEAFVQLKIREHAGERPAAGE